jgi:hypothetical protein
MKNKITGTDWTNNCPTPEELQTWLDTTNQLGEVVSLGRFGPIGACSFLIFTEKDGSKLSTFFLGTEAENFRLMAAEFECIAKAIEIMNRGDEEEIHKEFLNLAERTPTTLLN